MGLDATVYCDCFERGSLRSQPDPAWRVYVDSNGKRECGSQDIDHCLAFDKWDRSACDHEYGVLVSHYIGNMALVAFYRHVLSQQADVFPLLLAKVLYSGIHCGDFLPPADVMAIRDEVKRLRKVHVQAPRDEDFLRDFENQLRDLVDCAIRFGKPISF